MTKNTLYQSQDRILAFVFEEMQRLAPDVQVILGGGTALARCYLSHRISYDLDFFIGDKFDPALMEQVLRRGGFEFQMTGMENGGLLAAQLHGTVMEPHSKDEIKVSFVEDFFAGIFPVVTVKGIATEVVDGLYHRKLRTIAGTGGSVSLSGRPLAAGGRQTARDLFDLYVLDQQVEPLDRFISRINGSGVDFPADLFCQGLASIQWMDLIDECEALEVLSPWPQPSAGGLKQTFDVIFKRLLECDETQHLNSSNGKKNTPKM